MTSVAEVPPQGASWYEATAAAERVPTRLTFDLDVDVCVIGAGLAGLTTARELARRGWSVAVLEAGRIGGGASGRNDGFVLPGFGETMPRIIERVGPDAARELWRLADAGRAYVRETIRENGMPGVDPTDGWLWVSKFAEDRQLTAEVDELHRRFDADVELWPTERVRSVLRTSRYFNAIHYRSAFHIHPLNYVRGLATAAEAAGARIFEETPALAIDPAGVRKRIVTPTARVRAAQIVLAGNVALGGLAPRLSATLIPLTTFVAATAPLGDALREAITYTGAISDTHRGDNHYRVVDGDRLLLSGGLRTWAADPRRFARRLSADVRRVFPRLGKVEIAHVWSGTLGRTVHRMPQIGLLNPGVWVASGFGGHGLNTTAMAGMLIARAIAEGDSTWRVFSPYELVWAGGATGRVVIQLGYVGARLRDRAKFLAARLRHGAPDAGLPTAEPVAEEPVAEEPVAAPPIAVPNAGAEIPRRSGRGPRSLRKANGKGNGEVRRRRAKTPSAIDTNTTADVDGTAVDGTA
jgi:glycine/D-amino acid oxidase-like deaminating enzyme